MRLEFISEVELERGRYSFERGEGLLLIRFRGELSRGLVRAYAKDLSQAMDQVAGVGMPFWPLVVDLCDAEAGSLDLPTLVQAEQLFARRLRRVVLVVPQERRDEALLRLFVEFISMLRRDLHLASSIQEALQIALD